MAEFYAIPAEGTVIDRQRATLVVDAAANREVPTTSSIPADRAVVDRQRATVEDAAATRERNHRCTVPADGAAVDHQRTEVQDAGAKREVTPSRGAYRHKLRVWRSSVPRFLKTQFIVHWLDLLDSFREIHANY